MPVVRIASPPGRTLVGVLALACALLFSGRAARADVVFDFTDVTNLSTTPAGLLDAVKATLTMHVSGNQLQMTLNNLSSVYQIGSLDFNTGADVSGLALNSSSLSSVAIQSNKNVAVFGTFDWRLDFSGASKAPGVNSVNTINLDMTTNASAAQIYADLTKTSDNNSPTGYHAALHWFNGPGTASQPQSFFGSGHVDSNGPGGGNAVPEGSSLGLLTCGILPIGLLIRRRKRSG